MARPGSSYLLNTDVGSKHEEGRMQIDDDGRTGSATTGPKEEAQRQDLSQ